MSDVINNGRDANGRPYQRYICPCGASAGIVELKDGTRKFLPHFPLDKSFEDPNKPIRKRGIPTPTTPPAFKPTSDEVIVGALTHDVKILTDKVKELTDAKAGLEKMVADVEAEISKFSGMLETAKKRLDVFSVAPEPQAEQQAG